MAGRGEEKQKDLKQGKIKGGRRRQTKGGVGQWVLIAHDSRSAKIFSVGNLNFRSTKGNSVRLLNPHSEPQSQPGDTLPAVLPEKHVQAQKIRTNRNSQQKNKADHMQKQVVSSFLAVRFLARINPAEQEKNRADHK